jgi:hypothetical protein
MRAGAPRKRLACLDGTIFDVKMSDTDDRHQRLLLKRQMKRAQKTHQLHLAG